MTDCLGGIFQLIFVCLQKHSAAVAHGSHRLDAATSPRRSIWRPLSHTTASAREISCIMGSRMIYYNYQKIWLGCKGNASETESLYGASKRF